MAFFRASGLRLESVKRKVISVGVCVILESFLAFCVFVSEGICKKVAGCAADPAVIALKQILCFPAMVKRARLPAAETVVDLPQFACCRSVITCLQCCVFLRHCFVPSCRSAALCVLVSPAAVVGCASFFRDAGQVISDRLRKY